MRHTEEDTQISCVRWFAYQHSDLLPLLHHSPNGGSRRIREAARFKAMGTRAGFPDLVLLIPAGGYHAFFIEMKSPKGRQEEEQKKWQKNLEERGYKYVICRSFDDFRAEIEQYLQFFDKKCAH